MSNTEDKPAVDIDTLLAKVAAIDPDTAAVLKEMLDKGQIQIIALTDEVTAAKALADEYASFKQDALKLAAELEDATGVITGQKETITSLQIQIEKLQAKPNSFPVIEVDKKKYEVQVKSFKYQKETYTVAQLLSNKKLQKELVGKGMGFLVAVKED